MDNNQTNPCLPFQSMDQEFKFEDIEVEGSNHWLCTLLRHYPDMPHFAFHPCFKPFCDYWLQFQRCIAMAEFPETRINLDQEMGVMVVELHNLVVTIFEKQPQQYIPEDCESSTPYMIAAIQTLKERVEVMQHVLRFLEEGWMLGKDPLTILSPLLRHVMALRQQNTVSNASAQSQHYVDPAALMQPWPETHELPHLIPPTQPLPIPMQVTAEPILLPLPSPPQSVIQPEIPQPESKHYLQPETPPEFSPVETFNEEVCNTPMSIDDEEEEEEEEGVDDDNDTDYHEDYDEESDEEIMDEDDDYVEPEAKASSRRRRIPHTKVQSENAVAKRTRAPRQYTRRTATSYDAETTHYLKSVFFSIYSKRDKLTKDQRRQVQLHTGLKPRNITYWFSNHKRRFQTSLHVFKETVRESKGKIKTYDEFLKWRLEHGLPEEVLDSEVEHLPEDEPQTSVENTAESTASA